MMCVERINKDVESIERSGAVMTCKMDVDKEKIDKIDDVSENKGKDANVAEAADEVGKNGTMSDLLCSYWLCRRCIGILKLWGRSFWGSN
ncbi:hypothetical protein F8M41_022476 [Gigaspora margarita]|uniref:Uncharacterized protein n=1 Tax=Gigaspora margarita TaxID=4874 RepID=A0A8H4AEZ4_GIGMA|nr:hypothetical protein F8M41_022476 [Gigaspora margarita]